jgi:hypothetical protein
VDVAGGGIDLGVEEDPGDVLAAQAGQELRGGDGAGVEADGPELVADAERGGEGDGGLVAREEE